MDKTTLITMLAQASEEESRQFFQETMRKCVRIGLLEALEAEVRSGPTKQSQ